MALNDFGLWGGAVYCLRAQGVGFIWIERLMYTLKKCGPFRDRPEKAECPLV